MEVSPPQPEFHSPAMDGSTHLDVERSQGKQRSMPLDSTPSESTLREIDCKVRSIGGQSESTGRVAAAVLAKVDLALSVVRVVSDAVDRLDCAGDVGEVDKTAVFFVVEIDLLGLAKLLKIIVQFLPGELDLWNLVEPADVNVARRAVADGQVDRVRQRPRMLAPANLDLAVVDHEPVQRRHGVELRSGHRVYKRDEAHVPLRYQPDVVQDAAPAHVANLLDGRVRVQVAQVDRAVALVALAPCGRGDDGCGVALAHQRVGNGVLVHLGREIVAIRVQSQILGRVVLLCLGDKRTPVLAVEHFFVPVLVYQRQRLDALDGRQNRGEVRKRDLLLGQDFDRIDVSVVLEVVEQLLLGHARVQTPQVHVSGGVVARDTRGHHGLNGRGPAPANLELVAADGEVFQGGVGVEQHGRVLVQKRHERAVFGRHDFQRLHGAGTDVVEQLVGLHVGRDVAQIHRPAAVRRRIADLRAFVAVFSKGDVLELLERHGHDGSSGLTNLA
ncbi:hypothetical protein OGATHE_003990 [Ogataea polymorpha]|uniref:Uncharacterized protein n=1 Tax=Ogataea polymorpha TaxID=460523 RepID=A0A9P8P4N4_9ASCO|nr:hypothetical protein OGATHE_003990 [Ogataea polymorpha]